MLYLLNAKSISEYLKENVVLTVVLAVILALIAVLSGIMIYLQVKAEKNAPAEEPVKEEETPVTEKAEEPAKEETPAEAPAEELAKEAHAEKTAESSEKKEEPVKKTPAKKTTSTARKTTSSRSGATAKKTTEKEEKKVEEKPISFENGKWVIRKTPDGKFSFKLFASNGGVMLESSKEYASLSTAKKGIETYKKNFEENNCKIVSPKAAHFVYRLSNANGMLLAVSSNYTSKSSCENALESTKYYALNAPIEVIDV